MPSALIISAAKTIDSQGSQQHCLALEQRIQEKGFDIKQLIIEPLSADWHSPEKDGHFRSGCAPIEALSKAKILIDAGAEAVVISGEDHIKSGYTRDERLEKMAVYGTQYPLTEAYNELATHFITRQKSTEDEFRRIAHALFENYQLSYRNTLSDRFTAEQLPDDRWYKSITSLFRGVDCANPLVDFSGRMLICSERLAQLLNIPKHEQIEVKAVELGRLEGDGRDYIEKISEYAHLKSAYKQCCETAGVDFTQQFRQGDALLEVYTCYPVVPMAFLLASELVNRLEEIPKFLSEHTITVTGGMNLARAPWNNPALNGLISMYHQLCSTTETYGMVHGNGGLGYRQGVALVAKVA